MWSRSLQETWYSESSQVRTTHNAGIHDQLACIPKNCFWTDNWAAAYRYVIDIFWSPLKMRQFCRLGYDRWIHEDGLGKTSKPDNNNNIWKFCPPQHAEEECIAWWFQGMNGGNICSPFSADNPAYIVEIHDVIHTVHSSLFSMLVALVFAFVGVSAAHAVTFNVTVGANGNLAYYPPFVQAQPGDLINFQLWVNYQLPPPSNIVSSTK